MRQVQPLPSEPGMLGRLEEYEGGFLMIEVVWAEAPPADGLLDSCSYA